MDTNLFRQAAVEHQKNQLLGHVLVLPKTSHILLTVALCAWIAAIFVWLTNNQYARQETVYGWLEPPEGVVKIYADATAGKIKQILVTEGSKVKKGQPLAIVNGDRRLASGQSAEAKMLQELQKQFATLAEQIELTNSIEQQQLKALQQQIDSSIADLDKLSAQQSITQQRYDIINTQLAHLQTASKQGHIAQVELDQLTEQKLAIASEQQSIARQKIARQEKLHTLYSRQILLPKQQQNQKALLQKEQNQIVRQLVQLESQRSQIVYATIAGTVSNLQAKVGYQVNPQAPMMSIVPQDTQVLANLLVPVRAVGFVSSGQKIEIRYHAFPYQKFGLYAGEVISIADSVSLPNEMNPIPLQTQEPVYIVRAKLAQQHIDAYGQQVSLKSGMTLSADVQLGNRSLLEWVLEPLLSMRGRI